MQILIKDTRGQVLMLNTNKVSAILPVSKGQRVLVSLGGLDTEKQRNALLLEVPAKNFFERYRYGMKEGLEFLEMDFRALGDL